MAFKVTDPGYNPPPPRPNGLGERISNGFQHAISRIWLGLADSIVQAGAGILQSFADVTGQPFQANQKQAAGQIAQGVELPPWLANIVNTFQSDNVQRSPLAGMVMILMSFMSVAGAGAEPWGKKVGYAQDRGAKSFRFGPNEAWTATYRGTLDTSWVTEQLLDLGFDEQQIAASKLLTRQLLSVVDLREMLYRGVIDESVVRENLRNQGYSEEDQKNLLDIMPLLPSISDQIRFAVREVFSPDVRATFGQDEQFPPEFAIQAKKLGMSEEWARAYWAAHWELPSITQGFEMFHRIDRGTGQPVLSAENLDMLLKAQDVMPYWREKLKAISYNPYTRVDIRRMFAQGVIDAQEVYYAYRDEGYDDEHAKKITEWVTMEKTAANRDLAKTDVADGYQRGVFNRSDALAMIKSLGYDDDESNFYLDRVDYNLEKQRIVDQSEVIHYLYLSNVYNDDQMHTELSKLGMTDTRRLELTTKWEYERAKKDKLPTVSQLQAFLDGNVITPDQFRQQMDRIGYEAEAIEWFLHEIKPEPTLTQLIAQYKEKILTEPEFRSAMEKLGYNKSVIDRYEENLRPVPSLADLKAFFKNEVYTEAQFRQALSDRGFSPPYIDSYVKLLKG